MNFLELRRHQNALAIRFDLIKDAISNIADLKITYTSVLAKAATSGWENNKHPENFDEPPEYAKSIGKEISVWSEDVMLAIVHDGITGRNIKYEIAQILKSARNGPAIIPTDVRFCPLIEPSDFNWLPEEMETVRRSYRARITKATTIIRDINTTWKYLSRNESVMPEFIQPQLIGMFGGADHSPFVYEEKDFKWQTHGLKPKVMSARYLAPFIGAEKAVLVERSMDTIEISSAPRPGEPPTLNWWISSESNAIKVFEGDDDG